MRLFIFVAFGCCFPSFSLFTQRSLFFIHFIFNSPFACPFLPISLILLPLSLPFPATSLHSFQFVSSFTTCKLALVLLFLDYCSVMLGLCNVIARISFHCMAFKRFYFHKIITYFLSATSRLLSHSLFFFRCA